MATKNPMKRLFEEDDEDEGGADAFGSGPMGKGSSFKINEEYAKRYEHNKKREEKQKLEEKYGKAEDNDDSESSSDEGTEDEDGYLLTEDLDARMSAALQAIKNKDPRVYSSDAKFFDAAEAEKAGQEAAAASAKAPKEKPMYIQDYHRERYMRGDIGADDSDDEKGGASLTKTYQQEQDELKKALVEQMNASDDDDDNEKDSDDEDADDVDAFIKPKASTKAVKESAAALGVHPSRAGHIKKITKVDVENADKDPALFLSNFVSSRAWVPDDETTGPGWEAFDSEEDETGNADRENAEAFETAYNLRFEDPNKSNEVLKSYSRTVVSERSVRREEKTARQRQREQERERQEAEKQARRDERARLRKLNIEEAQEKLAKIKHAAGVAGRELAEDEWMGLLDDAWDNDAWEEKMRKQFGDDYYAEKDAGLESELAAADEEGGDRKGKKKNKKKQPKKPKWDDDIDIKDLIPDFEDEEAPKISLTDSENEGGEDAEEEADEDDEDGHESKRRKTGKDRKKDRADAKREARRERARIEALVDRQMAIDNPTTLAAAGPATGVNTELGGLFRYRETSPQTFGLTARDILLAPSDTALNEFAGLKKLATFRDEERKRKDRKKLGKKARLRQWRRDTFGADYEHSGPTFGFEKFVNEEAEAAAAAAAEASGHKKRKSKHRDEGGDSDADKPKKKKRSRKNKSKAKASEE